MNQWQQKRQNALSGLPPGTGRFRSVTPELIIRAQEFRNNLTPAEAHLWEAIRDKRLNGLRFRCQHPVGTYIFDFFCASCKLVIEVDGSIHDIPEIAERDQLREQIAQAWGFHILRFRNNEVMYNLPNVLARITETIQTLNNNEDE